LNDLKELRSNIQTNKVIAEESTEFLKKQVLEVKDKQSEVGQDLASAQRETKRFQSSIEHVESELRDRPRLSQMKSEIEDQIERLTENLRSSFV
jgi:peptidoglycan hydrolase CwlO-like protein